MTRPRRFALVGAAALVVAPAAAAKTGIAFDRPFAHAGDTVVMVLRHDGPPPERRRSYEVYLVRAERMGTVMYAAGGGGFRNGPPPRSVDPVHVGSVATTASRFAFRLPQLAPGRYAAVLYCRRCSDAPLVGSVPTGIPPGVAPPSPRSLLTVRR
jgi:hypothetical protein